MAKISKRLQVTIPKAIADQFGIRPGDEIEWVAAGDTIRVVPQGRKPHTVDRDTRLRLFDAATERQQRRQASRQESGTLRDRGWKREDLSDRGRGRR